MSRRLPVFVASAWLAAAAGCGRPPPPDASLTSGTPQELAHRIHVRSTSFSSVEMTLKLTWREPESEPEGCRAALSYRAPAEVRLRGTSASFFTVFDLVAGVDEVWLDVPREKLTVFGPRKDPGWDGFTLSPPRLILALLADPCPGEECGQLRREEGEEGPRLVGPGWTMDLDRAHGLPRHYRVDDGSFDVTWADWASRQGVPWPHEIVIRGASEAALRIQVGRVQLDRNLPDDRFRFEPDQDREIVAPSEVRFRWPGLFD